MRGRVHQISVSHGGVPKRPVQEARIDAEGVAGDRQATPKIHGGPDRAVCLFSLELIQALRAEGHPIDAGFTGENLTLAGIRWDRLAPGDRLRIGGGVVLEVTSYTAPCEHNARWFKDGYFRRISHKHHPGWSRLYARVVQGGEVRTGDRVVVEKKLGGERRAASVRRETENISVIPANAGIQPFGGKTGCPLPRA